jgi:uncharacterized protein (UPF0332 family)
MAFADDLLEQAYHLARREKKKPKQASLRRAVSTAYYALFHLLISEAVANWRRNDQRAGLARAFEHGKMKQASGKLATAKFSGQSPNAVQDLKMVADAFVRLQQQRQTADYDNSEKWSRTQAVRQINLASAAFKSWHVVRTEKIAQDYLLSLLVPPLESCRPRQPA